MSEGFIVGYVNFPNQPGYCDVSPATSPISAQVSLSYGSYNVQSNTTSTYANIFPGWDLNSTSNISVTEDSSKNTIVSGSLYVDLAYITTSTTAPYFTLSCPTNAISSPSSSSDTPSITIEVLLTISGTNYPLIINPSDTPDTSITCNISNGSYLNSFQISFTSSGISSTAQTALNSATTFSISVQITKYNIYYYQNSSSSYIPIPFCNGFGYNYTAPSTSTATNLISVNYNTSPTTPITIGIANYTNTSNINNSIATFTQNLYQGFIPKPSGFGQYNNSPNYQINLQNGISSSSSQGAYFSQIVFYNVNENDINSILLPQLPSNLIYNVSNVISYAIMMSNNGANAYGNNSPQSGYPNINGSNTSGFYTTVANGYFDGWPTTLTTYYNIFTNESYSFTSDILQKSTQPIINSIDVQGQYSSYEYGHTSSPFPPIVVYNFNSGYCSGLGVVIDNIPLTCTSTNTSTDTTFTYTLNPLKPQLIAFMNQSINNLQPFVYSAPEVVSQTNWTLGNQVDYIMSQGGSEYYNTSATYKLMKFFTVTLTIVPPIPPIPPIPTTI
jgi:hypothetical protein